MSDKKEIARLITIFLDTSILNSSKEAINKNVNRFTTEDGRTGITTRKDLRAYISKNIGSFFAKASAGICTSENIPLFSMENHFHINIVEGEDSVVQISKPILLMTKVKNHFFLGVSIPIPIF